MSECCRNHDGPHIHGCILPPTSAGYTHTGACILPTPPEAS